jgi:hypothetical protein
MGQIRDGRIVLNGRHLRTKPLHRSENRTQRDKDNGEKNNLSFDLHGRTTCRTCAKRSTLRADNHCASILVRQ